MQVERDEESKKGKKPTSPPKNKNQAIEKTQPPECNQDSGIFQLSIFPLYVY